MKREVIDGWSTAGKLLRLDIEECSSQKDTSTVDIGFAADQYCMQELTRSMNVSDRDCLAVRQGVTSFAIALLKKLIEKSSLNYQLVKTLASLRPESVAAGDQEPSERALTICLKILTKCSHLQVTTRDVVMKQFCSFVSNFSTQDCITEFSPDTSRLNTLYYDCLAGKPNYKELWQVGHLWWPLLGGIFR